MGRIIAGTCRGRHYVRSGLTWCNSGMEKVSPLIATLTEIEIVAEELLTAQQQVVDLDRRRNKNREALGAIRRTEVSGKKVWMCHGDFFVRTGIGDAATSLKSEQERLDGEISKLREDMKRKASKLADLEHRHDDAAPFLNLKALSPEESKLIAA